MPDLTGLPGWAQLGVGGLVAVLVLIWKRLDDRDHKAELAKMAAEYAADLKANAARTESLLSRAFDVIDNNTKALLALTGSIDKMDLLGRLDSRIERLERDQDDESPAGRRQR
jgi:hypothetical protein